MEKMERVWAPEVERVAVESATPPRADSFLAPVSINERKDSLGPHPSRNGRRSSDKGFLAIAEAEYLEILDWLARGVNQRCQEPFIDIWQ